MKWHEQAILFLEKAEEDVYAFEKLAADTDAADAIVGFHAQQAVEKMLKAVLTEKKIAFQWRHDLVSLLDLLLENDIKFPAEWEQIADLTPFAAEYRYGRLPAEMDESEHFDRHWALSIVRQIRHWAQGNIQPPSE